MRNSEIMKKQIKQWSMKYLPGIAIPYFSARARKHAHAIYREWGCAKLIHEIAARHGDRVLSGPFKGIRMPESSLHEHSAPYLLGVYESELHAAWEILLAGNYCQIFDIGAKFGYYAAGFSKRLPGISIHAFDTDPWARNAIDEIRTINDCKDDIAIHGLCNVGWLKRYLPNNALIISDCEGFEGTLFQPQDIASLATSVMVIETHDHEMPGVTAQLTSRFAKSHEVLVIQSNPSIRLSPVDLAFLTESQSRLALSDVRPQQSWLVMTPRSGNNSQLWEQLGTQESSVAKRVLRSEDIHGRTS